MKKTVTSLFTIKKEQESLKSILETIEGSVSFAGTNLWILIFAILIASIGLNLNASAVIIGAMLISPLMGPIIGIGVAAAINDSALLKKSGNNLLFAIAISLITSTLYFLLTPLSDAHSEILARTSPTIYDVLIAIFGGFAGIIAITSQKKGNVIPGVAIATALMPPLCTAGYGIANKDIEFLVGALYLFCINSVFIAVSAFIVARMLQFPYKVFPDEHARQKSRMIIWMSVLLTLVPSTYFGYDMIAQNRFVRSANAFIEKEAQFQGNYLLKKTVDPTKKIISLVYGGSPIPSTERERVQKKLEEYAIGGATLEIKQGFTSLYEDSLNSPLANSNQIEKLTLALAAKEEEIQKIQMQDHQRAQESASILEELQTLSTKVINFSLQKGILYSSGGHTEISLALVGVATDITTQEQEMIRSWLRKRVQDEGLDTLFQNIATQDHF